MNYDSQFIMLASIALAAGLGAVIGFEREWAEKPAGLRTHMLVSSTATLLVELGIYLVSQSSLPEAVRTDPIRIIEAVVVGISFLGAGTILKGRDGQEVEGLTTSASILATAAVGICTGLGLFTLAIGMAILILFINRFMGIIEAWFNRKKS
jgi:putative Mg2+ transporter-C (MgtC) family protein